jgi:hypothetical protein
MLHSHQRQAQDSKAGSPRLRHRPLDSTASDTSRLRARTSSTRTYPPAVSGFWKNHSSYYCTSCLVAGHALQQLLVCRHTLELHSAQQLPQPVLQSHSDPCLGLLQLQIAEHYSCKHLHEDIDSSEFIVMGRRRRARSPAARPRPDYLSADSLPQEQEGGTRDSDIVCQPHLVPQLSNLSHFLTDKFIQGFHIFNGETT